MFYFVILVILCKQVLSSKEFLDGLRSTKSSLSVKCQEQYILFLENLEVNTSSWALQMLDSSSKIPSGILSYDMGELGDFEQCIGIKSDSNVLGQYCLGFISLNTSTTVDNAIASLPATWALCLPDQCSSKDANLITKTLFMSDSFSINFSQQLCQTICNVNRELTVGAIITIVVLVLLLVVILLASGMDIYYMFKLKKASPLSIQGLSVYTNGTKIFKMVTPKPDQLPCLDGLRFISMMWVVAGHQYSIPLYGGVVNMKAVIDWSNSLHSMFLVSGTLSVDSFFAIGGTLMSYGFLKAKEKKVPFNIFLYYLHRYLRLTAPFAVVVLFSATLLEYTGSGPRWPLLITYFQNNCQDYWWTALLYIQNYVNTSSMCVGQTWYLNIDMQLYIISPLILFSLWKASKTCLVFLTSCCLVIIGVCFYIAWVNNLPALISNLYATNSSDYQNKYYLLTHTRATPWILGLILGYIIFQIKYKKVSFRINNYVVLLLWAVCCGTMFGCVLGGHSTLREPSFDKWGNALYIALVRPIWAIAICWIILACVSNNAGPINWFLSLPIYQVLNRFTYSIYLTHVTMMYVIAYGQKFSIYFTEFNMAYRFWGTLWFSTGLAIILVFLTESPIIIVEKILIRTFVNFDSTKKVQDPENGVDNPAYQK